MKKIFIFIIILLIIIIAYNGSNNFSNIAKVTKCDINNGGVMYLLDHKFVDANELVVINGKRMSCNFAWGPSEECNNLPKTNSCKTIYAKSGNIYNEPPVVTIEGLLALIKY